MESLNYVKLNKKRQNAEEKGHHEKYATANEN